MYAAKEDREMSREINEAHSTEVTLQKQNGKRERESQRYTVRWMSTTMFIYLLFFCVIKCYFSGALQNSPDITA